jgi:hypothetical protein
MGSIGPAPVFTKDGPQRADIDDISTPPAPIGGSVGTVAGGGTAVIID